MKNFLRVGWFVSLLIVSASLAQPSPPTPSGAWQRLEYVCANDFAVSQLSVSLGHITLIFENTFYPMQQVSSEDSMTLRFESVADASLLWLVKNDEAQLFQDGKVLADHCKLDPTPSQTVRYECKDDIEVSIQYLNDTAFIDVRDPTYGDQRYELQKTVSATGSRFSNGVTTWFVLGEEGNLYEEAEEVQHAEECLLQK